MFIKRATILNLRQFTSMSKVRLRYPTSLISIKTLSFVKNLSTATKNLDFHEPDHLNGEGYVACNDESNGFYSQQQYNSPAFQKQSSGRSHDCDFRGNYGNLQQNPVGTYGGTFRVVEQNHSAGVCAGNAIDNVQLNRQGNKGELGQNELNGFYSKNESKYFENVDRGYGRRSGYFPQNPNNSYELGRTVSSPQNLCNNYMGNPGMPEPNRHNTYPGSTDNSQMSKNNNWSNMRINQQSSIDYDGGSNPKLNGYVNNGMQNTSGSHLSGPKYHQQMSSESHNGMAGSLVPIDFRPDGQSTEVTVDSKDIGTVEELENFCKEGKLEEAIEIWGLLKQQGISLEINQYLALMNLCGEARALQEAKSVHDHFMRSNTHTELITYNKILEMYSKCGSMDDAYMVFNSMPQRNLTSWDTMIYWFAKNSLGEEAIDLFTQFKSLGLKPDGEMFLGVFSACGVVGDIEEGLLHFESMSKDYGIIPSMKHYVSVVKMLGSTGCLDEAFEFIDNMSIEPSVEVWETMMNLCRVHGNIELGDRCTEIVALLDPTRLNDQSKAGLIPIKASDLEREKVRKKQLGQNPLEVKSRVHEYRAGDTSHPENDKLYALLRGLKQQMKEAGYVPETKFVLHDIDQEGKEEALLGHSERLAVAQGLLTSPARFPLRIIKNLRVCGDCHSALKIISKLVGRELIIRDAKRFHHFKDGLCSCRDYW